MAVYVDPMMECVPNPNWRWTSSCHMIADSIEELMAFALKIGLKEEWFQTRKDRPNGYVPHFDLNEKRRVVAVRTGALEIDRHEAVWFFDQWRTATSKGVDFLCRTCGQIPCDCCGVCHERLSVAHAEWCVYHPSQKYTASVP
jgi:hypothetical protein